MHIVLSLKFQRHPIQKQIDFGLRNNLLFR